MANSGKRTVYSLSAGEYSDYRVLDLFEDRADAEANAARNPDWRVEEFDLYPPGSRDVFIPRQRFTANAWVNTEGRILDHVHVRDYFDYPDEGPEPVGTSVRKTTFSMISADGVKFDWPLGSTVYEVFACADDEITVRKAVQERAAKVAATLVEGGTPEVAY